MFPHGKPGWGWLLQLQNDDGQRQRTRLSERMWYRYHLFRRLNQFSTLHLGGKLFQQYLVDSYAVIDQAVLEYLRHHQATIRADLYNGVEDMLLQDDNNMEVVGRRIILPSSYTGGDRAMAQIYQDSMAIVRELGKPSLFVTVTANPHWREIQAELKEGQSAADRPDIIARVFEQKKKEILKDLRKEFGDYRGTVWTIEYQKRGLPHMHCLLFLSRDDNFVEQAQVDEVVCAQLPNEELDPNGSLT